MVIQPAGAIYGYYFSSFLPPCPIYVYISIAYESRFQVQGSTFKGCNQMTMLINILKI